MALYINIVEQNLSLAGVIRKEQQIIVNQIDDVWKGRTGQLSQKRLQVT